MNSSVGGSKTSGEARFTITGDTLTIEVNVEPAAGTTMVPFDDDPASMEVATGTYPKASSNGAFHYNNAVSLKALTSAFGKAFGDQNLDLDRRVVFIHGVFPSTKLPASAASLGPIPAHVTLPIACGKIKRVEK
jgi:hypothetical protein